ncbi:MAG: Holliday junction branch migration protein RuvA [Bacteroidia bacterium]|jgi:Holliday junction DNA helicase RuvA|nr:Holliday junction branch migration protein RuvA [Bacteroidia bacterium]GIV24260.1 MAG: Holliday junction ATP-dependent DNA helicase RuvA [Bacteroidia bacterium]
MVAYLAGEVLALKPHQILMKVGPLGITLQVPLSVSKRLSVGQSCTLFTVLWLPREEGEPLLYGFLTEEERHFFLLLKKVPRVGPQKALALLSHFSPSQLMHLIQANDAKTISSIKGIGPKLAQHLLLELRSALKALPSASLPPAYQEAYEAMLALGFTAAEAHTRLEKALSTLPEGTAEDLLQIALKSS